MKNNEKSNGLFASLFFSPGDADEFFMEFSSLTGRFVDTYYAYSLDRFKTKEKKPVYIIGVESVEIFGPLVYAIVKKQGIDTLRKGLINTATFLHLRKIELYSKPAEEAMKKVGLDSEKKVEEYLKTLDTKSMPAFKYRIRWKE